MDAGLPLHSPIATAEPPEQKARKRAVGQQSSGGVFRHPAILALAAMQHMKMPIWNFQRHLAKQACLYTRRCQGSRNCRGGVIRSAFRFRLAKCPRCPTDLNRRRGHRANKVCSNLGSHKNGTRGGSAQRGLPKFDPSAELLDSFMT